MASTNNESTLEMQNAVSFVEKGSSLIKFGSNGKKYQRHFFVDSKIMALCYSGSKKRCNNPAGSVQKWVQIKDITEVVRVEESGNGKDGSWMFTLAVEEEMKNRSLIAPSQEVRDTWMTGLQHLVSVRSDEDPVKQERMWLKESFANADRDRDQFLDQGEAMRLLNSLNVSSADADYVKQQLKSEKLDVEQFITLYNQLGKRQELEQLFRKYADSQQFMTADELARFFQMEEKEDISPETAKNIIACSEPCPKVRDRERLSLAGFTVMFSSPRMNIKKPCCLGVYQDMTQPLTQYFINSSHNTYLEGHQTVGASAVDQYRRVLSRGCRCVELDVWNGDDGEPVLFHGVGGYTMTSKVHLSDVLKVINDCAFVDNDQPVILSLENHASESQQARMAELFRDIFKERLFCDPLWQGDARFPSPNQLKGRVIIQGKKPEGSLEDDDSDEENEPVGEAVSDDDKQIHQEKKKAKVAPTQELASCVSFYQAEPFRSFAESSDKLSFLNISESKVGQWIAKDDGRPFVIFNVQKLTRVYPAWWRISSTNYNPVPNWMAGCQIVSLNFQTRDESLCLNDGFFEDNGRCGYVLKPEFMRCKDADLVRTQTLTVRVISGYTLPKEPGDSNSDIVDPYVQIEVHGVDADKKVEWTKTVHDNGFNPVWNETKQFTVTCPELALVLFRVADNDRFARDVTVAEYCLPVRCMQTGYRMIALRDKNGKIGQASLFVHISMD